MWRWSRFKIKLKKRNVLILFSLADRICQWKVRKHALSCSIFFVLQDFPFQLMWCSKVCHKRISFTSKKYPSKNGWNLCFFIPFFRLFKRFLKIIKSAVRFLQVGLGISFFLLQFLFDKDFLQSYRKKNRQKGKKANKKKRKTLFHLLVKTKHVKKPCFSCPHKVKRTNDSQWIIFVCD